MKRIESEESIGKTIAAFETLDGDEPKVLVTFTDGTYAHVVFDFLDYGGYCYVREEAPDYMEWGSTLVDVGLITQEEGDLLENKARREVVADEHNRAWETITGDGGVATGIRKVSKEEFQAYLDSRALKPEFRGMWVYKDECGWIKASNTDREYWISE